jgi:uncharacterized protein
MKVYPAAITLCCLINSSCRSSQNASQMSPVEQQQAIQLLRDAYAAFNRGDIASAVSRLDPNIDWTEPTEFPGGGAYRGRGAVAGYLTQSRAPWSEGSTSQPEKFIPAGNRIVVFVHARFRVKDSTEWHDVRLADVYTFKNGTPVAMRAFANREDAVHWAES